MKKQLSIILATMFAIILISTLSFATSELKNDVHNVTDTVIDGTKNLGEDVRNGIQNAENTIENGAKNIGNALTNDVDNTMKTNDDTNFNNTNDTGYTVTKTAATDFNNTMNSSIWTWIALAIAAAVIVGSVWFYAVEHTDRH